MFAYICEWKTMKPGKTEIKIRENEKKWFTKTYYYLFTIDLSLLII